MGFDVLQNPWIPAETLNGERKTCGITELLLEAHELKAVTGQNPLETYAVQRLLIAFLMDAYALENVSARRRLLKQGRFTADVIEKYVLACRQEGVSFDLFDEKRPFMQAPYDKALDADKEKTVALLFHALPRGNTPLHFEHFNEETFSVTPPEAFAGLLATQAYAVAMAQGYPSCVNNTPPYYLLVSGKNLFETLVLNIISKAECGNIPWDAMPAAWRDTETVTPKKEYAGMSMMAGLTWQPRRVTLIPEEDGSVRRIYLQQGRSFKGNALWKDPHVPYIKSAKGEIYSLKPKMGRMPWRDVGALAVTAEDGESLSATVVRNYPRVAQEEGQISVALFGLATTQAKYDGWISDGLNVPANVLGDWEKADRLRMDVALVEDTAKCVYTAARSLINAAEKTKDDKKKPAAGAEEAEGRYLETMHRYLFGPYMQALSEADCAQAGWEKAAAEPMRLYSKKAAADIVNGLAVQQGTSAATLQAQICALSIFRKELYGLYAELE